MAAARSTTGGEKSRGPRTARQPAIQSDDDEEEEEQGSAGEAFMDQLRAAFANPAFLTFARCALAGQEAAQDLRLGTRRSETFHNEAPHPFGAIARARRAITDFMDKNTVRITQCVM